MIRCVQPAWARCLWLAAGLAPACLSAAVTLSDPSGLWTSLGANYDFIVDQQTGDSSSDIVGDADNVGFFTSYDPGLDPTTVDDILSFRVRLDDAGGNRNNPQFDRNLWIGIDPDQSGRIAVFLGLNRQGSASEIAIYAPGTGSNTSPSTTSISNTPYTSVATSSSNYNYRPVDISIDGGTTNDMTPGDSGDPDYYVSFSVAFADVQAFLAGLATPINIDENTPLRYVLATSTQSNSLNQDLGGVDGGINSSIDWETLGGFSPEVTANGQVVPEPAVVGWLVPVSLLLWRRRRARRRT